MFGMGFEILHSKLPGDVVAAGSTDHTYAMLSTDFQLWGPKKANTIDTIQGNNKCKTWNIKAKQLNIFYLVKWNLSLKKKAQKFAEKNKTMVLSISNARNSETEKDKLNKPAWPPNTMTGAMFWKVDYSVKTWWFGFCPFQSEVEDTDKRFWDSGFTLK